MSCKISKKLMENGENVEKTIFSPFFPTKLNFYKKLLMKIAFYLMQKNVTFARDLCMLHGPKLKVCIHTLLVR